MICCYVVNPWDLEICVDRFSILSICCIDLTDFLCSVASSAFRDWWEALVFDRRRQEVPLKQAERRFTKSISKNGRILLCSNNHSNVWYSGTQIIKFSLSTPLEQPEGLIAWIVVGWKGLVTTEYWDHRQGNMSPSPVETIFQVSNFSLQSKSTSGLRCFIARSIDTNRKSIFLTTHNTASSSSNLSWENERHLLNTSIGIEELSDLFLLRLSALNTGRRYVSCCGKFICNGMHPFMITITMVSRLKRNAPFTVLQLLPQIHNVWKAGGHAQAIYTF